MASSAAIQSLLEKARSVLASEPQLLELRKGPFLLVGDTHGDVETSRRVLETFLPSEDVKMVFLGDYVDRGPYQIQNVNLLLRLKAEHPGRVFLLRGNHETPSANMYYGFYDEVVSKYSRQLYELYCDAFSNLPYGALLDDVICLHGGIAEELRSTEQISRLPKGDVDPQSELAVQILWNDPREGLRGFAPSARGPGIRYFGRDVLEAFLERNGLRLLVRAHEPQEAGFRYMFGGRLLSVFSCRFYPDTPAAALIEPGTGAPRRVAIE